MMPPDVQLTSEAFWSSALLWGAVDLALVSLLVWRIPLSRFRELKWAIAITGAVFWGILSAAVLWGTWDIYYRHFYPEFTRWLPPLVAVLCGAIGLLLWWAARQLPGNPVVNLLLLAGVESLIEHVWGIYGLGILVKVPMLQNASALSILVFAFFEYALYWGVILGIAALVDGALRRRKLSELVIGVLDFGF